MNETLNRIQNIFREVLDEEDIVLNESTTAADVEAWDSLAHIQLIVDIEKNFAIKFSSSEIRSFKNVGDICKKIAEKQS